MRFCDKYQSTDHMLNSIPLNIGPSTERPGLLVLYELTLAGLLMNS